MIKNKGVGQYDLEYLDCPCFWGTEPGKFVRLIPSYCKSGSVLDLGAGEGKNSVYLAKKGFNVTAVEVSTYAIRNFNEILKSQSEETKRRISLLKENVLDFENNTEYDIIIAYGLFHCLPSLTEVDSLIEKIKSWVKKDGLFVGVSFNDKIKVPDVQSYLDPTLLPEPYLSEKFSDWTILLHEYDVITETHPTTNVPHQHSLTRIIAKKLL